MKPTTILLLASLAACSRDSTVRDAYATQPPAGVARDDASAILAAVPEGADAAVRAARTELAADAPWRATLAIAPALADPARRTTPALLVAAAAAADREEWSTVDRLLAGVTRDGGFAALLRARSALARGAGAPVASRAALARAALLAALQAAGETRDATERGVRLVLAARALDRLAGLPADTSAPARVLSDSAREAYAAAAAALPAVADWISLRQAAVTRDSVARTRTLAGLRHPPARDRIASTEAMARERAGDPLGAAAVYAANGRRVDALALRLAHAAATVIDSQQLARTRAAIADSLVAVVAARSGTGEARSAVELIDRIATGLTPAQELTVARSAAASGPAARAITGFSRALAASLGTPRDRYSYATLLARAGRNREAATEFTRVRAAGGSLAADAAYQRGRSLLRAGDGAGARAALREVVTAYPSQTEAVTSARALLADLAVDDGDDAAARTLLLAVARQSPRSARADRAAFDAAVIALAGGDARTARSELDAIRAASVSDSTPDEEAVAATYWAGRASAATGDAATARDRFREVARRAPATYYAMLANRRLEAAPWVPTESGTAVDPALVATAQAAVARIALLERIGFDPEAGWERDWLTRWADSSADRMRAAAQALQTVGLTSAGMRQARRALDAGADTAGAVYRTLYPWPWQPLMRDAARARGLDPTLVAAVIRQESNFTPTAVSPAGAVGLMQLMPDVGRSLWNALGAQRGDVPWSPTLLRQPDVNVALGTRHLATALAQYPDVAYSLAAYNAGGTPVARWRKRAGTADPELFVERIPYDETRDYVRIVTRNAAFYGGLYRP